jgi:hypothetical protein
MNLSVREVPITSETVNKGSVKVITQVIPNKSKILTSMARISPMLRVLALCSTGSLLDTIEMKMMLSMPRTTSKKVRVSKASHASAVKKISMVERRVVVGLSG